MTNSLQFPSDGYICADLNDSTIDYFLPSEDLVRGTSLRINLKDIEFASPYGILILVMFLRSCEGKDLKITIDLPESKDVLNYLQRMSFFERVQSTAIEYDSNPEQLQSNRKNYSATAIELTAVHKEENVTQVVNELADRLINSHGCKRDPVNKFSEIMIETLQNVTQHTNPSGQSAEGLVAVQVYPQRFHFVIADAGIGIKGSLSANPRFSKKEMTDVQAIEGVLKNGYSRVDRPGRGGGLRRVQDIAKDMGGRIFIRSNSGLAVIENTDIDLSEVPMVKGTQIMVKCPKKVFQ